MIPFLLKLGNQDFRLDAAQSICPLKMLTGFPCPSCGITKSMVYFYSGYLSKSLQFHILGPATVIFCIFIIILLTVEVITKKNYFRNYFYNKKIAYTVAVFVVVYHTYRLVLFIQNYSWDQILKQSIWQ